MKKIVTVSGGVDSMVLLNMCMKKFGCENMVVAHFDHCSRLSSRVDREFVQIFCQEWGIKFEWGEAKREMSEHLSEEEARNLRYEFFAQVREKYGTKEIWTAQHLDDLVESVVINLLRGTGWRGLGVMNGDGVRRPFLTGEFGKVYDRREVLKYAAENGVSYRQDPTNNEDMYMRNRVREVTFDLPRETKKQLLNLRNKQCEIGLEVAKLVNEVIGELTGDEAWRESETLVASREAFKKMNDEVAMEVLNELVWERLGVKCMRPQLGRFLEAIREYRAGKTFNLPGDRLVKMGRGWWRL